jgi:hypothetical protein
MKEIEYDGYKAIELKTDAVRIVAIRDFGPRIAHLSGLNGKNILLWEPEKYKRGEWDLRGGHRVWVTRPGADEAEDAYVTDNESCELTMFEDGFRLTSPVHEATNLQKGFEVKVVEQDQIEVNNFVINRSELLYSGGIWALTCTVPGAEDSYAIPIGDGSDWDCFSYTVFRCWGGHGKGGFHDEQWQIGEDALWIRPQGLENKRMIQSHKGMMAMLDRQNQQVFIKQSDYDPCAQYPLNNNMAAYIGPDNFMVEMESMGAQRTIKPGQALNHIERWSLKHVHQFEEKSSFLESLISS